MEIKKLTITNIASLSDVTIDFGGKPLKDAPIFLISGDTGSGKSTILDAICLALYDKTPRMTSVTKEEIEAYDADVDNSRKYYSDDNSHLLRRGTGYGFISLVFVGNDGKEYEAKWSIQRNHRNPKSKLQRTPSRELSARDGSFFESSIRNINVKIPEITGLDYNQFCRTVMLAQGEFTKFLKSKGSEKAEILQKLTGTEIYSEVGKRIAMKFGEKNRAWERLNLLTKNIEIFPEEDRQEKIDRKAAVGEEVAKLSSEKTVCESKVKWLSVSAMLSSQLRQTKETLSGVEAVLCSEKYREKILAVKDYRESEVARKITTDLNKTKKSVAKKILLLPESRKAYQDALESEVSKRAEVETQEKIVAERNADYEKFEIVRLNETMHGCNIRVKTLTELQSAIEKCRVADAKLEEIRKSIIEKTVSLAAQKEIYENLSTPVADAGKTLRQVAERLDKIEISVNDVVREIRCNLSVDDVCPVCGRVVKECVDDSHFESILRPLREEKRVAEELLNDLLVKRRAADTLAKAISAEIGSLKREEEKGIKAGKIESDRYDKAIRKAEYADMPHNEAEEKLRKELIDLQESIKSMRVLQKEAEKAEKILKEARAVFDSVNKKYLSLKEEKDKISLALNKLESDIQRDKEREEELEMELSHFYEGHVSITADRVAELMTMNEADIVSMEKEIEAKQNEVAKLRGGIEQLKDQIDSHEKLRPDFKENDNEKSIKERIKEIESLIRDCNCEIGQLSEQLEKDGENRKRLMAVKSDLDKAKEEVERWEGLNRLLGDLSGSRFRSVAQSFILQTLLDNANNYMRCFTDRYTLMCNPGSLVILVKDCFKPSDPQPASILSGGECFMASLSLALGLANLRGSGVGADIIFIDEGFGTLSTECLANVMATLERLHQIGGRRVGLISHVAEMKERIPVQIHVRRESPAQSSVSIIDHSV